jgi:hypothetical protein
MSEEQPKALRLSYALKHGACLDNQLEAADELERLHESNKGLLEELKTVVQVAKEAHAHWDADRNAKVGKYLIALCGDLPLYDARITAMHSAIANATKGKA